jgi:hypothetical protein
MSKRNCHGSDCRRPTGRRYDVRMLKDFLNHLMWELRYKHYDRVSDASGSDAPDHPELDEQLMNYMRKYGSALSTSGLIVLRDNPDLTDDDVGQAIRRASALHAQEAQKCIRALETLEPLFEEALWCATQRGLMVIRVPASKLVDGTVPTYWSAASVADNELGILRIPFPENLRPVIVDTPQVHRDGADHRGVE